MVIWMAIGIMDDSREILLNAIRPYRMGVPRSRALNMTQSMHHIIGYLLIEAQRGLEV